MAEQFIQQYAERIEQELEAERIRRLTSENEVGKISGYSIGNDKDLATITLDVEAELNRIYHSLSAHKSVRIGDEEKFIEAKDDRNKIFSEYGVAQIMDLLSLYISKVHILSYYPDIETVNQMTHDFGMKLIDLISNKSEMFFYYPTPEVLFKQLKPIILDNPKDFSSYILYEDNKIILNEEELYMECVKLSRQELNSKMAHFPMTCLSLTHSVFASLMKAYKGETARNLRTMAHINQNISTGQQQMPQQKGFSMVKPSTWRNT